MTPRNANRWSEQELAQLDGLVRAGVHSRRCFHLFPGRSPDAIAAKFISHRSKLGIPAPSPGGASRAIPSELSGRSAPPKLIEVVRTPEPVLALSPEAQACRLLLRRHLQTGAHWLHGERFDAACRQAGVAR
ncbi:hypothetical protein [Sphingomonas soli]|uniref:hypothetical protein n=1 Tax=Sphingomonas soli TaxID=266127 RepID=UPI000A64140F|nr:hypothetical protein [Sphingomonas soli]